MPTKIHFDLPAWKDDKTAYMREYQKMKFYCTVCDKELSLSNKYKHLKRPCHLKNVDKLK
jgi:hypothetical protein